MRLAEKITEKITIKKTARILPRDDVLPPKFGGLIFRLFIAVEFSNEFVYSLLFVVVYLNVLLAILNLLPVPPLDGSRILTLYASDETIMRLEQMSFVFMIALFLSLPYLFSFLSPIILTVVSFLTGWQPPRFAL